MFQIRRRSRSTAQCSACKTTHLEQSQKAQKYVSDAADGYFMLKYVLSPNLVISFCFKSQVSKKNPKPALHCYKDLANTSLKPRKHLTANSRPQKFRCHSAYNNHPQFLLQDVVVHGCLQVHSIIFETHMFADIMQQIFSRSLNTQQKVFAINN